jgi:hypothetical protein
MRAILIAVLLALAAAAQTPVPAARLENIRKYFDARPGEQPLQCDVLPIKPSLGFSLRFQAGYTVSVPLKQYTGDGHRLIVATRITPEGGEPAYLFQRFRMGKVPETKTRAKLDGGYLLGEGRYAVECALFDDSGRVSRKMWSIDARLRRGDRGAKLAIPPGTVSPLTVGIRPVRAPLDAVESRLTILLHAAPLLPGRTRLRASDLFLLFSGLTSLLERLPARSVKLVAFNLDQQKELFRQDSFTPAAMDRVMEALTGLELGVVDYDVLKNRGGSLDLLAALVQQELHAGTPSDAVVLLGPLTRMQDALPREAARDPRGPTPRFYYLQFNPYPFAWSRFQDSLVRTNPLATDSISRLVARFQGKTIAIRSPGEFAKALELVGRR